MTNSSGGALYKNFRGSSVLSSLHSHFPPNFSYWIWSSAGQ